MRANDRHAMTTVGPRGAQSTAVHSFGLKIWEGRLQLTDRTQKAGPVCNSCRACKTYKTCGRVWTRRGDGIGWHISCVTLLELVY